MAKAKTGPRGPKKAGGKAPAKGTPNDIERVRCEKEVPVSMNREEGDRLAHSLASTTIKIKAINDEIAQFAADRRKKLRDLRRDEQRLANAIDTGKVMKSIKCWLVKDYRTNTLRYEDDAGATVAPDEVMPAEMRQKTIFDVPPEGPRVEVDEEEEPDEE